ncbi:helix-turn-helix domain-containing protein [Fictibacillus sp. 23RED33]|uniref:helix-turn-helix domain-containing protein n=1 Tax=Fictibacillus sp. 23RED33 TaxID=2745879 RepID=UPI0018CF18EC|nr:helix-turn-helix domain-containing protein [Fictibacillus sp. 23RED33]MBH0174967.1 helix-turn-helix domain-containing protein [Fictibacillus sp. 23RED33]
MQSKADFILHPVRMKIIQQLSKGPATVMELKEWVSEVPQATLYRHLNLLSKNEIIYVVEERKVRGAVERTYALDQNSAYISAEEAANLSKEEHMKMFMTFVSNVTGEVEAYLNGNTNLKTDIFGYNQLDLYLNDEEWEELSQGMQELIGKYVPNRPSKNNKRVKLVQMLVPEPKKSM